MMVFVSGCYDILHGGHIEFLAMARSLGTSLVVCAPTDRVYRIHKGRSPVVPFEHRLAVLRALRMVDRVEIGDDPDPGLNFKSVFLRLKPGILAVTDDDQFEHKKRALCDEVGASYVKLPKSLGFAKVSTSEIISNLRG